MFKLLNYSIAIYDYIYIIAFIGSIFQIFLVSLYNFDYTDNSFNNLLNSSKNINFYILFSLTLGFGCSYIPTLITDIFENFYKDIKYDILIIERTILTIFFILPSLITLILMINKIENSGIIYTILFRFSFITFAYIYTKILNRTIYKNLWSKNKLLQLFFIAFIISYIPLLKNNNITVIVFILFFILKLVYSINYLLNIKINDILYNNSNLMKEKLVLYTVFASLLHVLLILISVIITPNSSAAKNSSFLLISLFTGNKIIIFTILNCIYNTIPKLNALLEINKNDTLRLFIRNISHEIRTPMNVIQMNLENQLDEIKNLKNAFDCCIISIQNLTNESLESTEVAINILDEILEVDKINQGLTKYEKNKYRLGKFIEKICKIFHGKAVTKKVIFDYSEHKKFNNIIINIDFNKMGMVLRNFISNALKFTNAGDKILIKIILKNKSNINNNNLSLSQVVPDIESQQYNYVRIEVIDSGIGILAENANKLFHGSIQIDAAKNQNGGGNGFGLMIAKKHIEEHDGLIGVSSDGLEKGSTFWFEIPIEMITSDNENSIFIEESPIINNRKKIEVREVEIIKNKLKNYKPNILIVDDVAMNSKIVQRSLINLNCDSEIVENGVLCIELIQNNNNFDLIFMDNKMPIMDGPETTKKLRELGYIIPIIGLTGNVMDDDIKNFTEHGANEVLGKPTKKEKLNEILNKYLII